MITTTHLDNAYGHFQSAIADLDAQIAHFTNLRARAQAIVDVIRPPAEPVPAAPVVWPEVPRPQAKPVAKKAAPTTGRYAPGNFKCSWCGETKQSSQGLGQHKRHCPKRPRAKTPPPAASSPAPAVPAAPAAPTGSVMPARTDADDMAIIDRPPVGPDPDPMIEVYQCESCDWQVARSELGAFIKIAHHTEREHDRAATPDERQPALVPKPDAP